MFPEIRSDLLKDIQLYSKVNIGTITVTDFFMSLLFTCCFLCFPASVYKLISLHDYFPQVINIPSVYYTLYCGNPDCMYRLLLGVACFVYLLYPPCH